MYRHVLHEDGGFTLVEVMVAIAILMVGVLGTVAMVDTGSAKTSANNQREVAVNLTRDLVEASRQIRYTSLTSGSMVSTLQGQSGLADDDAAAAGWQITRRGTAFTVTATVCAIDDPRDGGGTHDSSYCSDSGAAGTTDDNPSDYSRVRFTVAWSAESGARTSLSQSTLVDSTYRGPTVTALDTTPTAGAPAITSAGTTSQSFAATTDPAAARVDWSLDGKYQAAATGSGSSWAFTWNLGTACSASGVADGNYQVGAQAFDGKGQSAGTRYQAIVLNRCVPTAATGLQGGRNRWGVELQWNANPESDIVGYYVYRGIAGATPAAVASGPCGGLLTQPTCLEPDDATMAGKTLTYYVKAVDRTTTGGTLRTGPASANLTVTTTNRVPGTPLIGDASAYGYDIGWFGTSDPDSGDSVDFYRVYRDGKTLADRYDVVDNTGSPVPYLDPESNAVQHTYYVVAVDTRLAESAFSNGVVK
jgi:prepilin-type N-terminal cleavage/methylation domain-containing protein